MTEKKEDPETSIEKLLSLSKITGINVHDFISQDMRKKLEKKYGKIFFPMLGLVIKDKQFFFLFHESFESIKDNKAMMLCPSDLDDKKIKELIDFIKKNKKGD